jgi:hypothetical protein
MATKLVEMAVHDPQTKKLITQMTEVPTVVVNIRNKDRYAAGRVFTDVCLDNGVLFKPGAVKTLEISQALATELKKRRDPAWELTTASPSPPDDDDDDAEALEQEVEASAEEVDATVVKRRRRA